MITVILILVVSLALIAVVACCCLAAIAVRRTGTRTVRQSGPSQWDAPAPAGLPTEPRPSGLIPRAEAAKALGVSPDTLRRNAAAWGIEQKDGHGRQAMVTVASVNARLAAVHGGTASG